jgi:ubiquinone/menaquinone biosynthesis C-methylase UbiE
MDNKKKTSWGHMASWYGDLLGAQADTYQTKVILPNIVRMLAIKEGERVLDIACGNGFFSEAFTKLGAQVTGVDIAHELIADAKKNTDKNIKYHVASADRMLGVRDSMYDTATIILALQNIENVSGTLQEANRVLLPTGKLYIVMLHPAFRIPRDSDWHYDEKKNLQSRLVGKYLSEKSYTIDMNPGEKNPKLKKHTITFHRPLQYYFKLFRKAGFAVSKMEEWISHKMSGSGPRQRAEDDARKEIPLFVSFELVKYR